MALLEVRELTVEYSTRSGPLRAVDGVSFDLHEGRALGIIGESGSGKTSLALTLMRLLPRNATLIDGRMRLDGMDLGALSDDAFRRTVRWSRMAMVFQGAMHSLNPVIRVGEQVGERLRADGMTRADAGARVDELLTRVGLPGSTASRYPHELSGGMKQRVMIATALTHHPALLILDEPTSALDVSIQAQIMNLLKELKAEQRITMLFITHDLALASDLCDDIAVMYAGQVRELGSAEGVLGQPLDPYSGALLAAIPGLHDDRPPHFLPGAPPDLRLPIAGCRFAARCPFVFDPCLVEPPPLFEVRAGHVARCWLHDPDRAAAAAAGTVAARAGMAGTATAGTATADA
jgi:peptide/nickel transport system ATP-binding protein